jgi:hypothetical protein
VRVRSDHDHLHRPFVGSNADEADLRRMSDSSWNFVGDPVG